MKIKNLISLLICAVMLFGICYVPLYADAGQNGAIRGVDLSRWNGSVDFGKLKSRGVDFAILRCYSYWKEDPTFKSNYNGAVAAGVKVGAYNYMYATTEEEAKAEAVAAMNVLDGRMLEYPYFLDIEDSSLTSLGKAKLTKLALIELKIFEDAGYNVGVYSSKSFLGSYLDASQLDGYDLWIARWTYYSTKKTYHFEVQPSESSYKPVCSIWQFSDGGEGPYYGIGSARVDMNYSYVDYAANPSYSVSTNPDDYTIPAGPLSFGANNNASSVRWVQAMLYNLGYRIAVCGKYTSYMKDIVRTFQSESRLPENGNVDSATLEALKNTFYEMSYTFTIKYKSSKNSLNVLDDTYPFFTNYTISNPGLEISGFKLSGWNVKRASDGKWLANDGKWYNKSEAADKLAVLPDGIKIRLNGEFCNSFKKKETIVFYAVWEEIHIPVSTVFVNKRRYDIFNDKCSYSDAVNAAQIKGGILAPLYDEKVLDSIKPILTASSYFIGASFDGTNLNWFDGTVSAPPEESAVNYSFVTLTKTDSGYTLGSLKENKKADGFIVVSDCKHKNTIIKESVKATCTSKGFSGDTYCKDCGSFLTKGKETEKAPHSYGEIYALSKATTKQDGIKAKKCSVCGKETTGTVPRISSIQLKTNILTCTGNERYPKAIVINSEGKTVSSKYYTLSYSAKPKNPGVYSVTVRFDGLYGGEKTLKLKIRPARATALKAFDVKKTSLQLKWKKAAGAKYYKVEKSVDGVNWTKVRTVSALSVKVSKLEKGGKYRFRIKSYDKNKKYGSDYSSVLKTGTRTAAPKITLTNASNSVKVSWGKVSGAKSYLVYKSPNGTKWSKAGETNKSSFRITGLTKGKQIYVKIRTVNAYGKNSDFSSIKSLVVGMKTPKVGYVNNGKISYSNGKYYITDSETKVKFLLVNKSYALPGSYGPGGLTKACKSAFDRLFAGAGRDGITINSLSAYRSYSYQKTVHQRYVNRYGIAYADRISAREGHSEHQTGLAIDCNSLSASFADTPAGRWLRANCANYGFIIRYGYGKEASTGYAYEPWHIRYIGSVTLAKKLMGSGLSVEEYYNINSMY